MIRLVFAIAVALLAADTARAGCMPSNLVIDGIHFCYGAGPKFPGQELIAQAVRHAATGRLAPEDPALSRRRAARLLRCGWRAHVRSSRRHHSALGSGR